jgi:hypothetical protein
MAIGLEYEFSYTATLKPPMPIGNGPAGNRVFVEVTGGEVEGKRLRGKFVGGGGDWLILGADGFGRLDVRAQIETHDGAFIYVTYVTGLLELNAGVQRALGGGAGTDFGDQYFRTNPSFETGDSRYAWLNQSLFVAEGHVLQGPAVEYKVYRVT